MGIVFHEIKDVNESAFRFAVIIAGYKGKWIFCKNKTRKWEVPGGHREEGESILETAKRELFEETGATRYTITPVSAYSIDTYGMLFHAEVEELGELPPSEIERIDFFDEPPDELSFPEYHPVLFERVRDDAMDEARKQKPSIPLQHEFEFRYPL